MKSLVLLAKKKEADLEGAVGDEFEIRANTFLRILQKNIRKQICAGCMNVL
jgi:hypothetical protein